MGTMKNDPASTPSSTHHRITGGEGGVHFDTGCNTSGVKSVKIHLTTFRNERVISRIFLSFHDGAYIHQQCFGYFTMWEKGGSCGGLITFAVPSGSKITRAWVWSSGKYVNAVQFETSDGTVSPIIGVPNKWEKAVEYRALDKNDHLAGMYGRYGGVIDGLGFCFSSGHVPSPASTIVVSDQKFHK